MGTSPRRVRIPAVRGTFTATLTPRCSVPRDPRIHLDRPGLDATDEVADVREPLGQELPRGGMAANTVMALEHEQSVLRQAPNVLHAFLVEMARALDLRGPPLGLRSNVEQLERDLAVQHRLELVRGDLPDLGCRPGIGRHVGNYGGPGKALPANCRGRVQHAPAQERVEEARNQP